MPNSVTSYPFTGGIDRSVASVRADKSTFWDLVGFRQSPLQKGIVEQTPYFYLQTTLAQGTYYNAGSQTEPTTSSVLGILVYRGPIAGVPIYVTRYVIRDSSFNQIKVFFQTAPATVSINTHCRLVINNVAGLGITLGSSLDVVIDGVTTFKWRKNGGGYTALVPITTAGVSIDGGNATLYFLTSTGFSVADTWTWTRTDASSAQDSSPPGLQPVQSYQHGSELFFLGPEGQLMSYQSSGCVVSAGYRPIFGSYLTIFEEHLVVGAYATSYVLQYLYPSSLTVAWSDLTDLHAFWATDVNEADSKLLPVVDDPSTLYAGILGVFTYNQQLYVLTNQGLFYTPYLGLPDVFSVKRFLDLPSNMISGSSFPVVIAQNIVYIVTEHGPYAFNGGALSYIGAPIRPLTLDSAGTPNTGSVLAVYNAARKELSWCRFDGYLYTYQELYGTFYRRHADFSGAIKCLTVSPTYYSYLVIGRTNRIVLLEDMSFSNAPVNNYNTGGSIGVPTLILQATTAPTLENVKDLMSSYLSALVTTISSTYYSTDANLQVILSWFITTTGVPSGSPSTHASAVWVNSKPDGQLSYPRISGHVVNFQLTLNGLVTNKPPGKLSIVDLSQTEPAQVAKR